MAGTKQIHDARVVVLRLDGVDPAAAADNLKSLGMIHAVGLTDPQELSAHIEAGRVDVVVLVGAPVPDALAMTTGGVSRPPGSALKVGIPCLLLVPVFSRAVARAAMAMGYAATMSVDAAPRLVYRRVGALMQRVRRNGRTRSATSANV